MTPKILQGPLRSVAMPALLTELPTPSLIVSPTRGFQANEALLELVGYTSEELASLDTWSLVHPEDREQAQQRLVPILSGQTDRGLAEVRIVRADGQERWVELRGRTTVLDGERVAITTLVDVTKRHHAEERYHWLSQATVEGITLHDKGLILDVNEPCARIFGYTVDEMLGRSALDFATVESGERIRRAITNDERTAYEVVGLRKDGSRFPLEIIGRPFPYQGRMIRATALRDITERKERERQRQVMDARLREVQRIDSIGQLAGGVAHDFNNLLSLVLNHCDLAVEQTLGDDLISPHLESIRDAAELAATMTRQLLLFGRKDAADPKLQDVNRTLRSVEGMLHKAVQENITLDVRLAEDTGFVLMGPSHLEQIVFNLALNARDAMPRGGALGIRTRRLVAEHPFHRGQVVIPAGEWVVIEVLDEGAGMTGEVLERAFDPFFTTKGVGQGTGLGLSTVHGVVTAAGGWVTAESEPGRGTEFFIFLPRQASGGASLPAGAPQRTARSGTILLVEDQRGLMELVQELLLRNGYEVVAHSDPVAALAWMEEWPRDIDLLLSDVVMPELSGPQLAERLVRTYPELRVLFMSGYSEDVVRDQRVLAGAHLIEKPFREPQLLEALATVLG